MAVITKTQLENASLDAKTLEEAVNVDKDVVSRLGATYPSVPKASRLATEAMETFLDAIPSAEYARAWASAPDGQLVDDGLNPPDFSAKHWAAVAEGAAAGNLPNGSVTEVKLADDVSLGRVARVVDRNALALLNPARFSSALLVESGRAGLFAWRAGNQTPAVSADPGQGLVVPPSSDTTGAAGAWVRISQSYIDARFFGAKFDGVTDDTLSVQMAIDVAAANGLRLFLPAGTAIVGKLSLRPRLYMHGAGPVQTTLKCTRAAGANGVWIDCPAVSDDLVLREFSVDGGRLAGDAVGADALRCFGSRPTIDNVTIVNARGWGLITDHRITDRTYSILGTFRRITIDRTGAGGWRHQGPNDSYAASVEIVDASQAQDLGFPGFLTLESAGLYQGTISVDNMHIWNRTTGVPRPNPGSILRPSSALQINAGGQKFVNSMFESGGNAVVVLNGGSNTFTGCAAFAPDSAVSSLFINSPYNRFVGLVGGNKDFFAPDYLGVFFASALAFGNHIDVYDAGCTLGSVDFASSGGNNRVIVRGEKKTGEVTFIGVPKPSDVVDISTDGPGGASLIHEREIPWTTTTATPVSGAGAFTSATATTRYLLRGKTVFFDITVDIANNGTAAGSVQVPLPLPPKRSCAGSGVSGNLTALAALVSASSSRVILTTAGGGYPGATGITLFAQGVYEIS